MMRGRWGYTRATWPTRRIKEEVAEIRAAPSMGRMGSYIPPGMDAGEVARRLAQRAAKAGQRRR